MSTFSIFCHVQRTIFYIVVFVVLFKQFYSEISVTALTTVIALLGFFVALGTNYLINRIKKKGKDIDNKN